MAAGLPSTSAGENVYCLTAASAAASKPSGSAVGDATSTAVTAPVASMVTRSSTAALFFAASAPAGYSGSAAFTIAGALVSLPALGGGGGGASSRRAPSWARAVVTGITSHASASNPRSWRARGRDMTALDSTVPFVSCQPATILRHLTNVGSPCKPARRDDNQDSLASRRTMHAPVPIRASRTVLACWLVGLLAACGPAKGGDDVAPDDSGPQASDDGGPDVRRRWSARRPRGALAGSRPRPVRGRHHGPDQGPRLPGRRQGVLRRAPGRSAGRQAAR